MDDYYGIKKLVGNSVFAIFMNDDYLAFQVGEEYVTYRVEGDCCSRSYFHDLTGVEKLLAGGVVTDVEPIPGSELPETIEDDEVECLQFYGYRITSEHPQWGPVSTVIGFRNCSNGYYGGWMEYDGEHRLKDMAQVTTDVLGD